MWFISFSQLLSEYILLLLMTRFYVCIQIIIIFSSVRELTKSTVKVKHSSSVANSVFSKAEVGRQSVLSNNILNTFRRRILGHRGNGVTNRPMD